MLCLCLQNFRHTKTNPTISLYFLDIVHVLGMFFSCVFFGYKLFCVKITAITFAYLHLIWKAIDIRKQLVCMNVFIYGWIFAVKFNLYIF